MKIIQKPACSVVVGDILVYDTAMNGERETAEVLYCYTSENITIISYLDCDNTHASFDYEAHELLACVDTDVANEYRHQTGDEPE